MAELQEQPNKPEQKGKEVLRIIHIEDHERFRELVGMELEQFPDVELVTSFSSTEEAEDYLTNLISKKQELPDVIVSDNNLGAGKRRGIQFAKDLREKGFNIPFVLFTGDAEQYKSLSREDLDRIGLKDIVDKNEPESTGDLVGILRSIKPLTSQDKPQ